MPAPMQESSGNAPLDEDRPSACRPDLTPVIWNGLTELSNEYASTSGVLSDAVVLGVPARWAAAQLSDMSSKSESVRQMTIMGLWRSLCDLFYDLLNFGSCLPLVGVVPGTPFGSSTYSGSPNSLSYLENLHDKDSWRDP
jgi:hypothetical protein